MRFVTKRIHAFLDYPVAVSLVALPLILGLGESSAVAKWLSIGTGIAALVLTLLTDHHLGVIRVLSYKFHLLVDLAVGVIFVLAPFICGFSGLDAFYYWANGGAVLTVVSLNKSEATDSGAVAAAA